MTLSKLSLRNAQRQAQDYLVYFVTIVMAAALVHAFNGLVFSQELRTLSSMMDVLPPLIVLASILVVCIIGWLVQYTIGFMLARRSRELGTYILIGLESKQVARLFFLENLAVGGVALALGLLLGNLLFQVLRALTLALFHVPYTFRFSFAPEAVGLTLLYFAAIYLFALIRNNRRIRTMKICELMDFDRKNEGEVIKKSKSRRRTFATSIVFGVVGTALLLAGNLAAGLLGAACVILFLYGFFISFSSGVPAYFDKRPEKKYKGCRLLIFRSLAAKLGAMGVVMATIALLFTGTLISEGSGMLFHALFDSRAQQTTCFDLFIGSGSRETDRFDDYLAFADANLPVRETWRYDIYRGENRQVTSYAKKTGRFSTDYDYDTLMKASDYAALRAMLGYPPVTLEEGQYLIHCMSYLGARMSAYSESITVAGRVLTPGGVRTESFTQSLWDGNGCGFTLVVPDELAGERPVSHSILAAMTETPLLETDGLALEDLRDRKDEGYDTLFFKAIEERKQASMCAIIVFPLYYLSLVLTMVAATILTIHQLGEAGRYRRQFGLLNKLGMDRREMVRTLRRQFAIYYSMPAVPPLLISVPFMLALGNSLDPGVLTGPAHLWGIIGVAVGLFFLIYLVYILTAYTSLKRNTLPV